MGEELGPSGSKLGTCDDLSHWAQNVLCGAQPVGVGIDDEDFLHISGLPREILPQMLDRFRLSVHLAVPRGCQQLLIPMIAEFHKSPFRVRPWGSVDLVNHLHMGKGCQRSEKI